MRKFTFFLMSLFVAVGAFAQVDYTPTNVTATNKTRNDRNLTSVKVGTETYTLSATEQTYCYVDKYEDVVFTVEAGQEVELDITTPGSWTHGSVYVDFDNNGFTAGVTENWKPTGDLVAYAFYNNGSISDASGWNSVGTVVSGDNRNRPAIPSYTIPAETPAGEYRIRFKLDWCNIDPNGDADGKFGDFMENGGQIVDAKLVVNAAVAPEPELPALEITGYTPTEAVEKLETITITFNDEIEGTFDMMAMSQIYLGSRSNGCSFAVEGNVLTITPFNAITTPGEYKLVIPSGLITRVADGSAVTMNGEIVFEVVAPAVAETFKVEASLFPTVEGDVTEIKGIRVEAGQGPSLYDLPEGWTLTNEAGTEFAISTQWLYDWETVLVTVNPAITAAGTYTLNIPEGSLKTDDGKVCEAASFSWTIAAAEVPEEPELIAIDLASNADAMLYSNAPCTNTLWGDEFQTWAVLFDNDANTIFHSEYGTGTSVDGLDHYLRVDLGEGNEVSQFAFTFTTRAKNCTVNSPTTIVVEGSNEADGTYTEITTINDIPQVDSYVFTSDILGSADGPAYRYIRYRVTATGSMQTDGGGKVFFFIAEFGMSKVVTGAVEPEPEPEVDEATVALIATAKELIALEGIGYPAAAAREAFQAAIDAAEAEPTTENGTALQAAIDAYYAVTDITLPAAGKKYTFTAVWGTTEYYMYNNNGTLAVAARGEGELPESAQFVCEYDEAAEYKFQFKTVDGAYYLAYPTLGGKSWLDNESETGLEATSSKVTQFNVNKILAGGNVSATNEQLLGLVQMDGYRGYDNGKYVDSYGPIVVKHSAQTFDGASAPYYNSNFTSAFRVEEVEVPFAPISVTPNEPVNWLYGITMEFAEKVTIEFPEEGMYVMKDGEPAMKIVKGQVNYAGTIINFIFEDYAEISEPGEYTFTIPAGMIKSEDGSKVYAGDTFTFTVVKPAPQFFTNPVGEGETVKEIGKITIEFMYTDEVVLNTGDNAPVVRLYAPGAMSYDGTATLKEGKEGSQSIEISFGETFTEEGEYNVYIPAGLFTMDGTANEERQLVFNLKQAKVTPLELVSVTPAAGAVNEIGSIIVRFNQDVTLAYDPETWQYYSTSIFLTNDKGEKIEMHENYNPSLSWQEIEYVIGKYADNGWELIVEPITEAGTYTLDLSQIVVQYAYDEAEYYYQEVGSVSGTCVWTIGSTDGINGVETEDGEQTIYDLTGRKIEKITNAGIYIVNGKKVLVK